MNETPDEKKGLGWVIVSTWLWLDGKKTYIGGALIALAGLLEGIRMAIESANGDPWRLWYNILVVTGSFIAGGGLYHQNQKLRKNVSGFDISHQYPEEPVPYVLTTSMDENKKS